MVKLRCPICNRTVKNLSAHVARFHPEDAMQGNKNSNTLKISVQSSKNPVSPSREGIVIVDGQNVANHGKRTRPVYRNLFLVYKSLRMKGYEPKIVISAALKYKIDNPVKLDRMLSKAIAIEAPAGEDDDLTILELASRYNAKIITNDRYLDHVDLFPSKVIETVRFTILEREVVFNPPI